jgi:aryl-alcohol dehydrogenase-like predicted oxidoreductase
MRYRKFGRLGWEVSEIGYGMWGMGGWTGSNDEESMTSLQRAVDLGCNFFDTAWGYGAGHSEGLLGQLMRANPGKQLYTATKMPPKNFKWPSKREFTLDESYPPDHIEEYVEKSLKNAGLDSFDLMQLHTWEDGWLEDDRWYKKLDALRSSGVIGGIGISMNRWEAWNGVEAVKSGLIDAVQVIYNIFEQRPLDELFPTCREHGVAVIARVPFDEGTLTGNLTMESSWPEGDWRNTYFVGLEAIGARGDDHGGNGAAVHPGGADGEYHHSRDAKDASRGAEHSDKRGWSVERGATEGVGEAPLGPGTDGVVAVITMIADLFGVRPVGVLGRAHVYGSFARGTQVCDDIGLAHRLPGAVVEPVPDCAAKGLLAYQPGFWHCRDGASGRLVLWRMGAADLTARNGNGQWFRGIQAG